MVSLFLGLTAANLTLLVVTFGVGLFVMDGGARPTAAYPVHLALGIGTGLMAALTHMSVYTYFMATSKWLAAAADKAALDPSHFVTPAGRRKRRVFAMAMAAVVATMLALFAGAAADPTVNPWWSGQVHMAVALVAIAVNMAAALGEYRTIRAQGSLMDEALAKFNTDASAPAATT